MSNKTKKFRKQRKFSKSSILIIYIRKKSLKNQLLTLNIFFDKIYERGFRKEREVFRI